MMLLVSRLLSKAVVVAMRVNFHNDAYNMKADMYDFRYFCVFLIYRIKAYAKTGGVVGKRLSIEGFVSCSIKKHFVYLVEEVLVPMMRLILDRAWRKKNPCEENKFHVMCGVC